MSRDRYDTMSHEELVRIAKIRGVPEGTIELFRTAPALAAYLRDDDYDRDQIGQWEDA